MPKKGLGQKLLEMRGGMGKKPTRSKMPPKGMGPGMHKMPGGMPMSDAEMAEMMGGKKAGKKPAKKKK